MPWVPSRKVQAWSLLAVAAVLVLVAECGLDSTHGLSTAPQMRAVLGRAVPPGTSLTDAQKRMASRGFKCTVSLNEPWVTLADRRDYLYCYRDDSLWLIASRTWQAAFFFAEDRIIGLDVTVYDAYP